MNIVSSSLPLLSGHIVSSSLPPCLRSFCITEPSPLSPVVELPDDNVVVNILVILQDSNYILSELLSMPDMAVVYTVGSSGAVPVLPGVLSDTISESLKYSL